MASVIRVDLERLAACVGCSAEDLVRALKQESTVAVEGEQFGDGSKTLLRAQDESDDSHTEPLIEQALISAATKPSSLDTDNLPRQLIQLGGATQLTVIEIILHNLWKAGIKRVVILVAPPHGAQIMDKINKSPVSRKLAVEFLNVGGAFGFHAKALLSAKARFQGDSASPFLLCSSDHIYDSALVRRMAATPLGPLEGRILIEEVAAEPTAGTDVNSSSITRKSSTGDAPHHDAEAPRGGEAVHVIRSGDLVTDVWRGAAAIQGDAYEAGLYALKPSIFEVLERLQGESCGYFTLCEAVASLAQSGKVGWAGTEGKSWLAIETREQLEQTQKDEVEGLLADTSILPWHCAIARNPSANSLASLVASTSSNNLAAAAAGAEGTGSTHSSAHNSPVRTTAGSTGKQGLQLATPRGKRPGLLVALGASPGDTGKTSAGAVAGSSSGAGGSSSSSSGGGGIGSSIKQAVLQKAPAFFGFAVHVEDEGGKGADLEKGGGHGTLQQLEGGFALDWSDASAADRGHAEALLVPLLGQLICPELDSTAGAAGDDVGGDVTGDDDGGWVGSRLLRMQSLDDIPELPSDIERIALTTIHEEGTDALHKTDAEAIQLQLLVTRKVPVIGIVILLCAAVGDAFSGPSAALITSQVPEVQPIVLSVWRFTVTALLFTPFFLLQLVQGDAISKQIRDPSVMIPNVMQAACTGSWGICFFTALKYTTVPLATLFASIAPLLLVIWKAITGGGVTLVEGVGVGIAMTGSVLCALGPSDDSSSGDDSSDSSSSSGGGSSSLGILFAVGAALSNAIYINVSKGVRPRIAPMLFMWVGRGGGMLFILAFAACTMPMEQLLHPTTGWLGWMSSWQVARTQIIASFLGDVVGSFGYFVTLKYLSPIVVATCALLNPVTATAEELMLGLGSLPGFVISAGAALILFGAGMVMLAASKPHDEVIDATIATNQITAADTAKEEPYTMGSGKSDGDKEPLLGKAVGNGTSSGYGSTTGQ